MVNVDLVQLLRQQVFIHDGHVSNHLQNQKSRQDGHHQALLTTQRRTEKNKLICGIMDCLVPEWTISFGICGVRPYLKLCFI